MGELGQEAEARGFDSLWVAEHSHIPIGFPTPWGEELEEYYRHTLDPFIALSAAAVATRDLKLATGVCLLVQRDPIPTAKECASLDHISGGRFIFGIGGGWNPPEMLNHGTSFDRRWKVLRERVEA